MLSIIKTMALNGIEGYLVEVQTDVTGGLPSFEVVGLPDATVREAKERIKSAIKNSGFDFPSRRFLINLAPANTKKEGSIFDLPMAIGILTAMGRIEKNINNQLEDTVFIGELSLDGKLNKVNGVLPMCIEAMKLGIKKVILPKQNAREAAVVKDIEIIPVVNLKQLVEYLNGNLDIKSQTVDIEKFFRNNDKYSVDFSEVKGQENVKRALEIAAAGGHNCLLIGSPGSGKTMMARRLPTILPDLTFNEALEITKIHSVAGKLKSNSSIITQRPFRAPHHTVSATSIVGGGRIPKPGEISLAHYGVLFLDELPEFNRNTLEVLRGPLEDRIITISRVNSTLTYSCNFMFVASMNPCMCGYYGSEEKECTCTPQSINRYLGRISGPLLDRIDIHIEVKPVKYQKLNSDMKPETSLQIRERVNKARKIQLERYKKLKIYSNAELTPQLIEKYCNINDKGKKILEISFEKLGLSARAYGRILKVARTIADLESSADIQERHLAEAIQYRSLDRKYNDKF